MTERITPKLLFGVQNSNSGVIWARFIFPNHCLPFLLLCFSSFISAQVTERITPKLLFGFQNSNSGVLWARSYSPIIAFFFCFFASLPLHLPRWQTESPPNFCSASKIAILGLFGRVHFPQSFPSFSASLLFFLYICPSGRKNDPQIGRNPPDCGLDGLAPKTRIARIRIRIGHVVILKCPVKSTPLCVAQRKRHHLKKNEFTPGWWE